MSIPVEPAPQTLAGKLGAALAHAAQVDGPYRHAGEAFLARMGGWSIEPVIGWLVREVAQAREDVSGQSDEILHTVAALRSIAASLPEDAPQARRINEQAFALEGVVWG